ncbi:MAG TPA: 30S ribosomal protein S6 [Chloroflexi bacterium]|nr:30S ribosomal protein S6 [Chloroflexota bacterium]
MPHLASRKPPAQVSGPRQGDYTRIESHEPECHGFGRRDCQLACFVIDFSRCDAQARAGFPLLGGTARCLCQGQTRGKETSMRNYEIAYIADPELDDEALAELEAKVKGWIEAAGGKLGKIDRWGKRRLAYPIKKKTDGHYVFIYADMPTEAPAIIERDFRLSEQILRFMFTLQEPQD